MLTENRIHFNNYIYALISFYEDNQRAFMRIKP